MYICILYMYIYIYICIYIYILYVYICIHPTTPNTLWEGVWTPKKAPPTFDIPMVVWSCRTTVGSGLFQSIPFTVKKLSWLKHGILDPCHFIEDLFIGILKPLSNIPDDSMNRLTIFSDFEHNHQYMFCISPMISPAIEKMRISKTIVIYQRVNHS